MSKLVLAQSYFQTYGSRWRGEPTLHKLYHGHIACRPLGPLPHGEPVREPDPDYPLPRRCRICFSPEELAS